MVTPVTSDGSRSGVNWIRDVLPWMDAASALASVVLPVPGLFLSGTSPSENRQINDSLIASGLPTSARPIASVTAVKRSANAAASVGSRTGTPVPSKVCTGRPLFAGGNGRTAGRRDGGGAVPLLVGRQIPPGRLGDRRGGRWRRGSRWRGGGWGGGGRGRRRGGGRRLRVARPGRPAQHVDRVGRGGPITAGAVGLGAPGARVGLIHPAGAVQRAEGNGGQRDRA